MLPVLPQLPAANVHSKAFWRKRDKLCAQRAFRRMHARRFASIQSICHVVLEAQLVPDLP